jgi:hypothetical protein
MTDADYLEDGSQYASNVDSVGCAGTDYSHGDYDEAKQGIEWTRHLHKVTDGRTAIFRQSRFSVRYFDVSGQ